MPIDKAKIKEELVDKSNNILAKYAEKDIVESVSVMNMAAKTVFLGSLRVYNDDVVSNIKKDLKNLIVRKKTTKNSDIFKNECIN